MSRTSCADKDERPFSSAFHLERKKRIIKENMEGADAQSEGNIKKCIKLLRKESSFVTTQEAS